MSSPHPEGAGAAAAMRAALAAAGLQPSDVDYINLHGTGTPSNDAAEDLAVCSVFGTALPCSSAPRATPVTRWAPRAASRRRSRCSRCSTASCRPGSTCAQIDPALHLNYLRQPREQALRVVASNSFGFGGSNACLVFGAAP